MRWSVTGVAALIVVGSVVAIQVSLSGQAPGAAASAAAADGVFHHQRRVGQRRQPGRTGRRGQALSIAGRRGWRRQPNMARVSECRPGCGQPPVNARDRIGNGPWYNAKGVLIAANVADLHGDIQRDSNNIRKPNALIEKGEEVKGVGDQPNQHDILTDSDSHGRLLIGAAAMLTCNNWTSSADTERTIVGHHDRLGGANASWNAVHASAGCSQPALVKTGGNGLFYCFAQ